MMEAAPAASLVVPEAQLLFQLLVIALDPPAQFGQIDQAIEGHVRWDGGKSILGGLGVALGPFDQQPFLIPRLGNRRDAPPAPEPGQSVISALPRFPRARRSSASLPPAGHAQ